LGIGSCQAKDADDLTARIEEPGDYDNTLYGLALDALVVAAVVFYVECP
jgi:hypothetical protein